MNTNPSDWRPDDPLWQLLGKAPRRHVSTNFAHLVRQKAARAPAPPWGSIRDWPILAPFFHHWEFALVTAALCMVLGVVYIQRQGDDLPGLALGSDAPEEVIMVQHCELIQDLDVIEQLDDL